LGRRRQDGPREPNGRLKRAPRRIRRLKPWLNALGRTGRIYFALLDENPADDPGRYLLDLSRLNLDRLNARFDFEAYVTGAGYFAQNAESESRVRRSLAQLERVYAANSRLISEWLALRRQTKFQG
jgi:hypothetical protein